MIPILDPNSLEFPDPKSALTEPNGLLAVDGDLSPARIFEAYKQGIFPWFSEGEPLMWWSPDPRCVLYPDDLKISRSLQKILKQEKFSVTTDQAFEQVIHACAEPRDEEDSTWITPEMIQAYSQLHAQGIAHSVEVWQEDKLVGGLYGLHFNNIFCGESMFSTVANASKVAFAHLAQQKTSLKCSLIDCQLPTEHLLSMGATTIPRERFLNAINS